MAANSSRSFRIWSGSECDPHKRDCRSSETGLKEGIECTIYKKMVIHLIFLPETNEPVFRWLREHVAVYPDVELQFCGICQQSVNEMHRQEDGGQYHDDRYKRQHIAGARPDCNHHFMVRNGNKYLDDSD